MNYTTKSQKLCSHILCANGAVFGGYCLDHQSDRAEAAESRAAQLESEIDLANAHAARLMDERDEARQELNALKRGLSEAFNSNDGTYRP